jgi:hypothetical protein
MFNAMKMMNAMNSDEYHFTIQPSDHLNEEYLLPVYDQPRRVRSGITMSESGLSES